MTCTRTRTALDPPGREARTRETIRGDTARRGDDGAGSFARRGRDWAVVAKRIAPRRRGVVLAASGAIERWCDEGGSIVIHDGRASRRQGGLSHGRRPARALTTPLPREPPRAPRWASGPPRAPPPARAPRRVVRWRARGLVRSGGSGWMMRDGWVMPGCRSARSSSSTSW